MWWLDAYDLIFGIVYGVWLGTKMHRVPVTTKVTLPHDPNDIPELPEEKSYYKTYAPTIARLKTASVFGDKIVFGKEGAYALGHMLETTSKTLDKAVSLQLAKYPEPDPNVKKFMASSHTVKQARANKG